jgi:hypothetical protein
MLSVLLVEKKRSAKDWPNVETGTIPLISATKNSMSEWWTAREVGVEQSIIRYDDSASAAHCWFQ